MFCYQCQEAARGTGCNVNGVCGKKADTAELQDLLVYVCKGIAVLEEKATAKRPISKATGFYIMKSLFVTITNANFDNVRITAQINEGLAIKAALLKEVGADATLPDAATWTGDASTFAAKALAVGVMAEANEDVRSLKQLVTYGLKGVAAYTEHAEALGYEDDAIYAFAVKALAMTTKDVGADVLVPLTLECGAVAVTAMALLDTANTTTYGHPEITTVNIGVKGNPGILISGHDLRDMQDLLEQTAGTGVDVYTHSEMLPANYYPAFKKYPHFVGNYGNAWYKQDSEFTTFNGPILMTTNCITPVKDAYKDRFFTTGQAGWPGATHIADRAQGGKKDFSAIIALAKTCAAPTQIEEGSIVGGFAHNQVIALADKVVGAVKSGAIKRFVVMAGCDGRHKERDYFTQVATKLPKDTVILTAGCAKYRYNKLDLGDIGGIPRVLDAGQCNDSYSLAVIALKLKEVFGLDDINKLPLSFDIAWYEQKAVTVLLALLHLGVKNIRLGPTLPAFLSPNVAKVLVETFGIRGIGTADEDIPKILIGE